MLESLIRTRDAARRRPILAVGLGLFVLATVPALALALVAFNCVLLMVHLGLHVAAVVASRAPERHWEYKPTRCPYVSIHLPICSEPPALVKGTLDAIARMDYPAFEVIVLDNNTHDEGRWRPVQQYCERLGERFGFVHIEHLPGAKAAALNRCLELTSTQAELVAVVDADYQPSGSWLADAVASMNKAAYVQFPQAYRDGDGREGLERDYAHYFATHMRLADRLHAPLLTGTMCVVHKDVLQRVGGWSSSTITEDAELGLRLVQAGVIGRYVHRVRGRGVMPTALASLGAQRRRWVHGNAQTLLRLRWSTLRRLGWRRAVAVIGQLTAWFNFLLVPIAVLLAMAPWTTATASSVGRTTLLLATASVWTHLVLGSVLRLVVPCRSIAASCQVGVWKPVRAYLAMSGIGAVAWLEPLLGVGLGFHKTDKSGLPDRTDGRNTLTFMTAIPAVALALYVARGDIVGAVGAVGVLLLALSLQSFRGALRRSANGKESFEHVAPAL